MTTLILPGWLNSGPSHWQSLWEAELGYERVMQHDWMHPLRGDWITRLEERLLSIKEHFTQIPKGPEVKNALKTGLSKPAPDVVLVAHSLGCHLVASWAALSQNTHLIRGALLVAPPDVRRTDFPQEMRSWRQPVLQRLPFKSICVVSSNDPFCEPDVANRMAASWGSERVEIGERGHINADSGLADWPYGRALLTQLRS
jgi:uncharacterized protein